MISAESVARRAEEDDDEDEEDEDEEDDEADEDDEDDEDEEEAETEEAALGMEVEPRTAEEDEAVALAGKVSISLRRRYSSRDHSRGIRTLSTSFRSLSARSSPTRLLRRNQAL